MTPPRDAEEHVGGPDDQAVLEMGGRDDEFARTFAVLFRDGGDPGLAARVCTFAAKLGAETETVAVPCTSRFAEHVLVRPDPITRGEVRTH